VLGSRAGGRRLAILSFWPHTVSIQYLAGLAMLLLHGGQSVLKK